MGTVDLADFLLARIAEDEAAARGATAGPWRWYPGRAGLPAFLESTGARSTHWVEGQSFESPTVVLGTNQGVMLRVRGRDAEHIAAWHPTRVRAECAAKRAVLASVATGAVSAGSVPDGAVSEGAVPEGAVSNGAGSNGAGSDELLRALAQPYADHPDFREEWRV